MRIYCPCPRCERAGVVEDGSPCPVCDGYGGFWLITGNGLQVRAIPGNADEVPDELDD